MTSSGINRGGRGRDQLQQVQRIPRKIAHNYLSSLPSPRKNEKQNLRKEVLEGSVQPDGRKGHAEEQRAAARESAAEYRRGQRAQILQESGTVHQN